MSEVTNLLLAFSILEPEDERVGAVNEWLVRNDHLMAFLRTVPWEQPDSVQLIVHGQHDTRWHVIAA